MPQSVPPMTFSLPTVSANSLIRHATSSGCSTVLVAWPITPGIRTVSSGSFAPRLPFMLMTGVRRLEQQPARAHLQQHRNDILDRDVGDMRAVMASPADMVANAVSWNVGERVVEYLDARLAIAMIFRDVDALR